MTASVSVQASANQPPTVSITSPANGASFTAPAVVPSMPTPQTRMAA